MLGSDRWPFRYQILSLIISIIVAAIGLSLAIAVPSARKSARDLTFERLKSAASIKAQWVRQELDRMGEDLILAAESDATHDALRRFTEALNAADESGTTDPSSQLMEFLRERFGNGRGARRSKGAGGGAPDSWVTDYGKTLLDIGQYLRAYRQDYDYADTLYVDAETGRVVYSALQAGEFLRDLNSEPLCATSAGCVFQSVMADPGRPRSQDQRERRQSFQSRGKPGDRPGRRQERTFPTNWRQRLGIGRGDGSTTATVHFEDFELTEDGGPTASFGTAVFDTKDRVVGVLIYKVGIDRFNRIMVDNEGLGETGETYLVGPGTFMRSDSRFAEESTILRHKVRTPAVGAALRGESGEGAVKDYRDVDTLSVWMPIEVFGAQWALVAQMDKKEAYVHLRRNLRRMFLLWAALGVGLIFVAYGVARKVDRPLCRLVMRSRALARGEELEKMEEPVSGLEMRELVETFDDMARQIRDRTTALEQARERAERSSTEANRANEIKTEFLGIASHELKNPLTLILGASSAIESTTAPGEPLSEKAHEMLSRIGSRAEQMQHIIEDFLDFQALEDGQIRIEPGELDLNRLAGEVVEAQRDYAKGKGIELQMETPDNPTTIEADAARIDQVVQNLVGNAIKFSPQGAAVLVRTGFADGMAFFDVRDAGPGLSEKDMEGLFAKYARLGNRPTGGEKSSGLGLAISKQLVDLHGGDIGARNNPEGGATFWLRLPTGKR